MKLTIRSLVAALILCAVDLSAAALTFESTASCTAGANTVAGTDSCLARNGFTFAGANSSAQPLAYGEVNLDVGTVVEGNGNFSSISARAGFEDFFLVYGQPDGTPAFLQMTANVYAGTEHALPDAIRLAGMSFSVEAGFGGQMTLIVPFSFGDVMDFSVLFELGAAADDCEEGCNVIDGRAAGFALREFRVLNNLGQELSGYRFHSESETAYNFIGGRFQDPAAVPEPATSALTGIGFMAAALARRKS